MKTQTSAASNTSSTSVEVNFSRNHLFSNVLTALVEFNFERDYVAHKMAESPEGSLYHAVYKCLFAENAPGKPAPTSASASDQ